jgi:hypothetical protein
MRAILTVLERERLNLPTHGPTECSPWGCWQRGLLTVDVLIKAPYDEHAKPTYFHECLHERTGYPQSTREMLTVLQRERLNCPAHGPTERSPYCS